MVVHYVSVTAMVYSKALLSAAVLVASVGVAVTLLVALVVVAVYSSVSDAKAGVIVTLPIVSPERELRFLPSQYRQRSR